MVAVFKNSERELTETRDKQAKMRAESQKQLEQANKYQNSQQRQLQAQIDQLSLSHS